MKKLLLTSFLLIILFAVKTLAATNCGLQIDKFTSSKGENKFQVYNPTDNKIIVESVKYYKGDTFWREYNLPYEEVYSKNGKTIIHQQQLTSEINKAFLNCRIFESKIIFPYNDSKDEECSFFSKILSNSCEQKENKKNIEKLKSEVEKQRIRNECIKNLPVKSGPIADIIC